MARSNDADFSDQDSLNFLQRNKDSLNEEQLPLFLDEHGLFHANPSCGELSTTGVSRALRETVDSACECLTSLRLSNETWETSSIKTLTWFFSRIKPLEKLLLDGGAWEAKQIEMFEEVFLDFPYHLFQNDKKRIQIFKSELFQNFDLKQLVKKAWQDITENDANLEAINELAVNTILEKDTQLFKEFYPSASYLDIRNVVEHNFKQTISTKALILPQMTLDSSSSFGANIIAATYLNSKRIRPDQVFLVPWAVGRMLERDSWEREIIFGIDKNYSNAQLEVLRGLFEPSDSSNLYNSLEKAYRASLLL